jgi:hypothetical protein
MSNQKPQNQIKTTEEEGVEKRRRFIKGAAAATPVILTLASPSVLGTQIECLSQQLSGNASLNAPACQTGDGPVTWLSNAWPSTFIKGTGSCTSGKSSFTGGTMFNSVFGTPLLSKDKQMSKILCVSPASDEAVYVAAILNAQAIGYVLDAGDVINLRRGTQLPPAPFSSAVQFLKSTFATP